MKNILKITLILLTIILSGCAFTTETIDIAYTPQNAPEKVSPGKYSAVHVEVNDKRLEKSKVSSKKNGYGMETASILSSNDIAVTVKDAIEAEIRNRGFNISQSKADINICSDVTRFYSDHKMGFFSGDSIADFEHLVTVTNKSGDTLFLKQVSAQGKEPNIMLLNGANAKLALDRALDSGIKELFSDKKFMDVLSKPTVQGQTRFPQNETVDESKSSLQETKQKIRKHKKR